jgi:diacylglycerol kinase family enzyme
VAASVPIGIIPAGSDNSLVWTVLGVKDPISAALSIVRGGLTPIDVFSVEWIQSGTMHYGTTVSYFGFISDGNIFNIPYHFPVLVLKISFLN